MRQAVRVLMEAAPPGVDVGAAQRQLEALAGVTAVHDLHIWTVTDGIESASAHVVIAPDADWHAVLDDARQLLTDGFGVTHATIPTGRAVSPLSVSRSRLGAVSVAVLPTVVLVVRLALWLRGALFLLPTPVRLEPGFERW